MAQDLILVGKTKYKTAKILTTKFSAPQFDKDMNLIKNNDKGDAFSTALTIAHAGTIYNSPFIAAKGDLVVFIATPKGSLKNDDHEVIHVMICVGDGLFSGVANDVLDPTFSSERQIFTTEELIKLGERGMHNTDDVSNNTPLTIRVLRTEDEEVEPEKLSMIYIPDKKYDGKFGDRALWANGIALEKLSTQQGSNRLTIKNSAQASIIVNCIKSNTGTRWRMEWSSELLDTSAPPS